MSTALAPKRAFEIKPVVYGIADQKIDDWAGMYLPLTTNGVDDKDAFETVHNARMTVKNARVDIEKTRKALKADALEYGKVVDAEAKRLTAKLEKIETHLESQEKLVTDERERLRIEREAKARAATQARVDALGDVGRFVPFAMCEAMTEAEYQAELAKATEAYNTAKAERERKEAEEAAARKAEAEKLAAERAELEKLRAEQQAEANRLAAERRKLEEAEASEAKRVAAEKAAKEHAENLERIRVETEARVNRETEERLAREAEAARIKAEKAEARRLKALALRPDKEKLLAFAEQIESLDVPELSEQSAQHWFAARDVMFKAVEKLRAIAATVDQPSE